MDCCRWIVQVVLRPEQTIMQRASRNAGVVERTLGWLVWCRRLNKDYELLPQTSETSFIPDYGERLA